MRVLAVFAPLILLASYVVLRALRGRPLSRRALAILVALTLLAYLTVTAGLGIFWVARMDLPVFDWHYLFGYALLTIAAAHLALELRGVVRFFRRTKGPARVGEGPVHDAPSGARPRTLPLVLGAALIVALGALLVQKPPQALAPRPARPLDAIDPPSDGRLGVERLFRESSYSRAGLFRSVALAPAKPNETKVYAGRPRIKLDPPARSAGVSLERVFAALDEKSPSRDGAIPSATLTSLLFHANGATASGPGYTLRAAASSGALYPTDVYLVLRDVSGLEPGGYYYDGPAHELVRTHDESPLSSVRQALMAEPGLDASRFFVVFGTTFDRTASKYTVRSYRYLALDAGHVALNLLAAARALGITCTPSPGFDDERLAGALALNRHEEAPLLVLACGGTAPRLPPATPLHRSVPFPPNADDLELTRLSSAVTSIELLPGLTWLTAAPAPRPPGNVALPRGLAVATDLFETIRARRSFREFSESAVAREDFAGVLSDAASLLGWLRGAPLVELFVVASRVEGVEPGSYRYDAERHALFGPLVPGKLSVEQAGLDQALLGRAAFVLAFALIDERAGTAEGVRDFRYAGLEAGISGEAAYLSATARGLGISGVGAFYDEEAGALFARDGRAPRVLYLMGVGARH